MAVRTQPKREKVGTTPGFYRTKRTDGFKYEFRAPGSRKPVYIPGNPTKDEAIRWRNKYLGLEEHERTITTATKFLEYATSFINKTPTLKTRTRRHYHSQVRLHLTRLHHLKLHEIDADKIRKLVIAPMVEKGLSGNTVRNAIVVLSSVMAAALDEKKIVTNPVASIGKRARPKIKAKRKRILTPEEAAKFIGLSGDYAALFGVMLFGGLRLSEALGLTWGDVDFRAGKLRIWRQLAYSKADVTMGEFWTSLKGDEEDVKDRDVEMSGVLRTLLVAHRGDVVRHRDDLLFTTKNATPIMQRFAGTKFAATVVLAGLNNDPALTPHQCRHNFASALIASGADIGFVADQLGHEDPNVTLGIYRHEFKAARESGSAAAAIDAIYGAAMAH
jgi:integrase